MEDTRIGVQTVLTTTPSRWLVLAGSLPAEILTWRPNPGEWSAVECLQHLIDVEKVFQFRVACFLKGVDFPAFNPDTEGSQVEDQSPSSLALEFERLREQSLQTIEALHTADLGRSARHSELGPVTLREMLNEWAAHDLNHTVQAERALMQPFIAACGPWRVYFSDHILPA